MDIEERTARIRALNDRFRTTWDRSLGKFLITPGIDALRDKTKSAVFVRVIAFSAFDDDNDPHREHDFGSFKIEGSRIFWKIDYYDPTLQFGSEDPADPAKTTRLLTIMLAQEY